MIHTVQQGDTLFAIARRYNLTTAQLLELNNLKPYDSLRLGQQLIVSVEQGRPSGQPTEFYVVQAGDSLFAISRRFGTTPENLLKINGMQPSQNIYVGQQLKISGSPPPPTPQPTPPVNTPTSIRSTPSGTIPMQGAAATYYTVQRGDSLYSIAVRHGLTPEELLRMNNLPSNAMIYIGQSLKVGEPTVTPTPVTAKPVENKPIASTGGGVYTVQQGDSLFSIAQRFGSTPQQILQLNGLAANATIYVGQILKVSAPQPEPPASNQNLRIYIVQRGDSLFRIAQQANTTPEEIVRLNQLANGGISVGQQLLLPPPGTGVSPTPTPTPVAPTPAPVTPTPTPTPTPFTPSGNSGPIPSSVPPHLREKYAAIRQARSIFQLEETNGLEIFGSGLSGPVGKVPNMMPADLEKVQARLIQLKLLTPNHGESPAQLMARLGRSPISEGSIPNTVKAIIAFQNRYKTDYWTKNEKHVQMLGTRSHTPGVVAPGDVTYRVMREYAEYRLVLPHATLPGQFISASFSNYVRSFHTIWEGGIGFAGVFMPDVPFEVFANLGIDRNMAVALKYVSSHEGNFDAINTYDKANFSWGFIQFAGKGGNTNGPLNAVIGTMKVRQPQLFAEYFQKIGIDVDVIMRDNRIHDGVLRVFDLNAVTGAYETQGLDAEIALKYDKQLYGAFIRAAYHPEFYKAQIERAVVGYVNPAMSIRTDVNTGQLRLTNIPLTNIISSPMGNCLMLDLTVNQWINRTRDVFRAAIEKVAAINGLHTPQLLQGIDERQVIQSIIADATDDRIKKRASSILNSELSSAKSPSVPPLA